jgi:hypothetical protein
MCEPKVLKDQLHAALVIIAACLVAFAAGAFVSTFVMLHPFK